MVSVIDIVRRLCTTCSYQISCFFVIITVAASQRLWTPNFKFWISNFNFVVHPSSPPSLESLQCGAAHVKIQLEAVFFLQIKDYPPKLVFIAFLISRLYRLAVWLFKRRSNIIQSRTAHVCVVHAHTWSFQPACIVAIVMCTENSA